MKLAWRVLRFGVRSLRAAGHLVATGWIRTANWVWAAWFTLAYVDEWGHFPAIAFRTPSRVRIKIRKQPSARLVLRGRLVLTSFIECKSPIGLTLWSNSTFVLEDDFIVADGVRIVLDRGGHLLIKGGIRPGSLGFHSHALIMVRKRVELGRETGVSFYGWVTDSDWHSIGGSGDQSDVVLGDRVWIGSYTQVLKGAVLRDGCIVAANATVLRGDYAAGSLLAGSPAKVIRTGLPAWD